MWAEQKMMYRKLSSLCLSESYPSVATVSEVPDKPFGSARLKAPLFFDLVVIHQDKFKPSTSR